MAHATGTSTRRCPVLRSIRFVGSELSPRKLMTAQVPMLGTALQLMVQAESMVIGIAIEIRTMRDENLRRALDDRTNRARSPIFSHGASETDRSESDESSFGYRRFYAASAVR